MSGTLNKVLLIGNLGNDIKIHRFEGGGCIGNVSIATSHSYKKKDTGEKVDETDWHNLVFRNKAAESMEKHTTKGDKIYAEGRLKTRSYETNEGTRYTTEVNVTEFKFLSTKKLNETPVNSPAQVPASFDSKEEEEDDDLPF